ncbi:MAG: ATP-binding cassette domain-containing protein [Cytophagales bacterium]|nr:ATP-binding cassette domain-containing protein [Cytophagales bacterium]MDW8384089.1 ATP-binding cassette domain-containing protein [Flammeovirgaceae bacterium]
MLIVKNLKVQVSQFKEISYPSFSLAESEKLLISGNSGSGKTTLLYTIAGLLKPSQGEIIWKNTTISQLSKKQADAFRARYIGFATQKPFFIDSLNVLQNLVLAQKIAQQTVHMPSIQQTVAALGIEHILHQRIQSLSAGELQRLSLARSLLNRPALLLADEPTANLDDHNCQAILQLLLDVAQHQNLTILVASHDKRLFELFKNRLTLSN